MIYLVAFFLPPLYFFMKGRWITGIFTTMSCLLALVLIFSMVGAPIGIPLWFVASICAIWDLRKRMTDENTTMLAKKMAEAMRASAVEAPRVEE